jgi:hypothetical protein
MSNSTQFIDGCYNIICDRYVNRYLSCTTDGKVDFYEKDDDSGRQKWIIKRLSNGIFSIQVYGGVVSGKFLTARNPSSAIASGGGFHHQVSHTTDTILKDENVKDVDQAWTIKSYGSNTEIIAASGLFLSISRAACSVSDAILSSNGHQSTFCTLRLLRLLLNNLQLSLY